MMQILFEIRRWKTQDHCGWQAATIYKLDAKESECLGGGRSKMPATLLGKDQKVIESFSLVIRIGNVTSTMEKA